MDSWMGHKQWLWSNFCFEVMDSKLITCSWPTLILSMINRIYRPHAVHYVHFPFFTSLVNYFLARFWCQLRHAVDHVLVALEEVSLLEISEINIGQVTAQIILLYLGMCSMWLWLIITVTRLWLVVVHWQDLGKGVLLLESSLHDSWLVLLLVKVAIIHRVPELVRLHVVVSIRQRIALPILRDLHFFHYVVFVYN